MAAVKSFNTVKELPLFAQLAFAVRCARRVVNLFRLQSNHPHLAKCCKGLGAAIRLAESFAAGNDVSADELAAVEEGTVLAVAAACDMHPPNKPSAYAANAVYAALCTVKAALDAQGAASPAEAADRLADAVQIAHDAAASADDNVERSARVDCELLHRMALGRFPDFGQPVDPGENGPLGALFQDFSRGAQSSTQPAAGGAANGNKSNPAATGRSRSRTYAELGGTSSKGGWAAQVAEVDGLRTQIEADRLQIQADRAAFEAAQQALQMKLASQKAELEQQQLSAEQRAAELAARQRDLDDRELKFALLQEVLEEELRRQEQELTSSRRQLEAEKHEAHAVFDSLEEERREFLEERLRWNPAASR